MEEFETITITNQDGEDVEYELVTIIEDEKKDTDDVEIYTSKIVVEDGEEIIEEIEDDKEWEKVSKILDDLFKDITE